MIDLSSKRMISPKINALIDAALQEENLAEPKRKYLGGSQVGAECDRQLQFSFFNAPKDPGKDFDGRVLRIFDRGHWAEAAMIRWMRLAGVKILTHDTDGKQFGFSEHGGMFKGHCDGKIMSGPEAFGPFPRLWENKGVKASKWRGCVKDGVKSYYPVYYAQMQIYMDRFGLTEHPALFSAVNADTMEIYWESVPFSQSALVQLDAKAGRVLQSCIHGELLPRVCTDPNFFSCKWCSWHARCWSYGDK